MYLGALFGPGAYTDGGRKEFFTGSLGVRSYTCLGFDWTRVVQLPLFLFLSPGVSRL